ncbi:hypothetical protein [Janibacter anophelis]|uniref:hypothetical protein n=1 Tax=Janibacter anophelis TaxID=319054 RepID=UPI000832E25B|nr:hypothetical protein [Janibacter anophelis]
MKRLLSTIAASGLLLTAAVATAPTASASDRTCRGTIGAVTVDNVTVPKGATCKLRGTRVKGNVKVNYDSYLSATYVSVDGNIQTQGHRWLTVTFSDVEGNTQAEKGKGMNIRRNTVDGDIQVFDNYAWSKNIWSNRVDGNLQCKNNRPAPAGKYNVVKADKEGQCRSF